MKNRIKIGFILISCFFFFQVKAQDFHLSQYDAAPLNTNPALTGMFAGKHRFHLHYRTQWASIATQPFSTFQAAWDMRINEKWAVGAQLSNYRAGSTHFNVLSFLPSVSYNLAISSNKKHRLTLGISAGFFNQSISPNDYTWGNQFVNDKNGGHFDDGITSGEKNIQRSIFKPDFNFGALYFFADPNAQFNPFAGITLFHLSRPKNSLFRENARLPIRFLLHTGVRIKINDVIDLLPKIYWQIQKRAQEITISGEVDYYIENPRLYLIGALTYRIKDAVTIMFGGKWHEWMLRMSYDINTSKLTAYSKGRGAFEIGLTYIVPMQQKPATKLLTCPRL